MLANRTKYLNKDKLPPGTIRRNTTDSKIIDISVICYNSETFSREIITRKDIKDLNIPTDKTTWIHCSSTLNASILLEFGNKFEINPLILENIQNIEHRPKLNDTEQFNFIIQKNLKIENGKLVKNHIAYLMFPNLIITFANGNPFSVIEDRIINYKGLVRGKSSDYLLFCLMDVLSDDYFEVMDLIEQEVIKFEEELIKDNSKTDIDDFLVLKNQLDLIYRYLKPLPTIIEGVINSKRPPINIKNLIYFKDLLNNTLQLVDLVEMSSKSLDSLIDLSINISGYKMNKIMKVLTIFSTIFMPLTFIAGIYGMNFKYMPELEFNYSYPIVIGVMIVIVINMTIFFKKNKWF